MKAETLQLEFLCPKCGESGLTPRLGTEKALAVARGDLQLRCPRCAAIIAITEPLAKIMIKAPLQKAADTISSVFRGTLMDRDHNAHHEDHDQFADDASDSDDLNHPLPPGANRISGYPDVRPPVG